MPLQATSGAASYDGFGGGVPYTPTYIEDVFSTYLYTATGSNRTITNNIDLSTKGGLVWVKERNGTGSHILVDTVRGASNYLQTSSTAAQSNSSEFIPTFFNNGFATGPWFGSTNNYVSWTFRKQPKFFDIVTYTGNGANRTIAHNLGSVPGCIIVKRTSGVENWTVYHRSQGANKIAFLNLTNAFGTNNTIFGNTSPTSTVFTLGDADAGTNANGSTYVAYLFAHDAGGFGLTGTDNVISCGSYTGTGALNNQITLGYEPQLVIVKAASISGESWWMLDNMRGMPVQDYSGAVGLRPNTSDAEASPFGFYPTATGFVPADTGGAINQSGVTYIYIAIRRGPMKVPTSGTSVFSPKTWTGTGATANVTGIGFPSDLWIAHGRNLASQPIFNDRLRGAGQDLFPNQTTAETTQTSVTSFASMDGVTFGTDSGVNLSTYLYINYAMRRAPSFFDVVCYTGNSTAGRTVTHNLTVAPELMIVKRRNDVADWMVWSSGIPITKQLNLNKDVAAFVDDMFYNTLPTSSQFYLTDSNRVNGSSGTYVAYLFATLAGVSKVFSYTGNGSSQTINCGFTGGSRFVLIKRTDAAGDWYVWDTARGIVSGNDPHLSLNTTAAEVTTDDTIDTDSTGFVVNQVSATNVNVSSATYIGLAIA